MAVFNRDRYPNNVNPAYSAAAAHLKIGSSRLFRTRIFIPLAVLLVICTYWILFADPVPSQSQSSFAGNHVSTHTSSTTALRGWSFDPGRDRNNHALTHAQCDHAFPDLYHEIHRSRDYWNKRQGQTKLTSAQIALEWSADGGLRAMIYDQRLYIIGSRGLNHFLHWKERSHATLHQIQRALLAAREPIPNVEFSIKINDKYDFSENHPKTENSTLWVFSRDIQNHANEAVWIIPDFNFWAYPRVAGAFGDFQRQAISTMDDHFESKIDKLVWRGTTLFNPQIREALLSQAAGKSWSAVHKVVEDSTHPDEIQHKISMTDHCRYKFASHTEGTTWSGRLKYLLSCHSVVFIHPLKHFTHLYHLLQPTGLGQNYVAVSPDWSDLPSKIEHLLQRPKEARVIADNAAKTFRDRYATPAAQSCYWRELFRTWSTVAFAPDPWESHTTASGNREKRWRGMTYEEYIFIKKDYP